MFDCSQVAKIKPSDAKEDSYKKKLKELESKCVQHTLDFNRKASFQAGIDSKHQIKQTYSPNDVRECMDMLLQRLNTVCLEVREVKEIVREQLETNKFGDAFKDLLTEGELN